MDAQFWAGVATGLIVGAIIFGAFFGYMLDRALKH